MNALCSKSGRIAKRGWALSTDRSAVFCYLDTGIHMAMKLTDKRSLNCFRRYATRLAALFTGKVKRVLQGATHKRKEVVEVAVRIDEKHLRTVQMSESS